MSTTQHTFPENMSPADNRTSALAPISQSASARPTSLARNPGALPSPYPSLAPPRRAMYHVPFVPRPFPPPSLADVPLEYIVAQLRRLAPHYWSRPETSDCTIGTFCSRPSRTEPRFVLIIPCLTVVSLDHDPSADKVQASAGVCDGFRNMGISAEMSAESFELEDGPASAAQSPARKSIRPRRMIMKVSRQPLYAPSSSDVLPVAYGLFVCPLCALPRSPERCLSVRPRDGSAYVGARRSVPPIVLLPASVSLHPPFVDVLPSCHSSSCPRPCLLPSHRPLHLLRVHLLHGGGP